MQKTMNRMTSIPHLSGGSMVMGFIVLVPGALLYLSRPESGLSTARLVMERAFIMAAVSSQPSGSCYSKSI